MREELLSRLRNLSALRQQVEELEEAIRQLTPAEQLVIRKRVMEPEPTDVLCQLLEVEPCTIYRWRKKALQKLEELLYPKG